MDLGEPTREIEITPRTDPVPREQPEPAPPREAPVPVQEPEPALR